MTNILQKSRGNLKKERKKEKKGREEEEEEELEKQTIKATKKQPQTASIPFGNNFLRE